jgi:hypothetical protein
MNTVKVQFQFGRECRSAILESEDLLTFESLLRLTERTFSTCKHPFTSFIYVDDDGDRVTVFVYVNNKYLLNQFLSFNLLLIVIMQI